MPFSGSFTSSVSGTLGAVTYLPSGDFLVTYSYVTDTSTMPVNRSVIVKGDGTGIYNQFGQIVITSGSYNNFLNNLNTVKSNFDAGFQNAANSGKPVF